ncbi:MAG: C10 family peptidase, partial [Bacteroidales bacterium]|nr:C10 family peptidase [Bacteroidales bacterium]
MRKSILLTVCFVAVVSILKSAPVDTMTCMRVASNFYRERAGTQQTRSASPVLAKTYKALPSNARDSVNCLYIYNVGDGYVIVSADDRITPVVGYSTEGNFDEQRMPIQLQEWLSQYAAAIGAAVSSPTFTNEAVISSWRALASDNYTPTRYGTVMAGPLMDTHWNQSPRYNNYCPYNDSVGARTITGCVATAMAQLIRYWQYPSQGIGSYSYAHPRYGTQTANFGNTTYNYNLMPLQLTSSSSTAEINEVAKLMYHCGVSVNMDYGLGSPYDGGSGASSSRAAYALNTFFGYSGCQYELRSNYSDSQWLNKLKQELNNARPVFYDGSGTGGHAFICDGYTVDNYFHFNFGWGGYLDGYFLIDNITPGSNNFNNNQGAIFNVTAALPILRASETAFDYLIESGTYSEGKKVNIITHHLSDPISVTTSSPFAVSTDSIHYSHSLSLDTVGGAFYVRYEPATGIHSDVSQVTISSGSLSVSVSLSGNTFMLNCIPVQDLNIVSSDLQHINLSWTRPQIDTTSQILTWNEGLYSYYSFPSDSNKFILLQRFAESDLVPYHNKSLTGITFFVPDGLTSLKLLVYVGGSYASSFNPGTQVVEQTIPVGTLTFNAWNTFTLSNPVAIDASQELCFGVYMTSTANYPIPIGSTHVSKKSFILGYTSASGSSGWYEPSNFNVAVRARIQNTQSVTHYEVSRDGTLLGSTASPSYNDIVSHTDTYHYTVTAYWDNGCSADASLDFTNVASITANPRVLEFHNNYGYSNTIKTVQVNGNGITQPIQISVTGNFRVSTNGTTFSTSTTMAAAGGTLYVKYVPTSVSTSLETGTINITTGTLSASVALYGQCHNDCLPPENLSLSSSGSTVNLSWNTPTVTPAAPSTLSWCSTISSVRYGSGTKATMVHRYATSDLTQLSNRALTSISFATYNISTVTKCKVVVYKGGSYTGSTYNSGTLVYEQEVPLTSLSSSAWTWNNIALTTPVPIDITQELWFGVYMEYSGTLYYLVHNSTIIPNKSNLY